MQNRDEKLRAQIDELTHSRDKRLHLFFRRVNMFKANGLKIFT